MRVDGNDRRLSHLMLRVLGARTKMARALNGNGLHASHGAAVVLQLLYYCIIIPMVYNNTLLERSSVSK